MKATKTPSGKYRALAYVGKDATGKRIQMSFTADTKKEAEYKAARYKMSQNKKNGTLGDMVRSYIDLKKQVFAPNTVAGYESILEKRIKPYSISKVKLSAITNAKLQEWISYLSGKLSAKSVKNAWGLVSATLKMYLPDNAYVVMLPSQIKHDRYLPTQEDIDKLLEIVQDIDTRRAILLGAYGGLRREEICALTGSDIKDNTIRINKACTRLSDGTYAVKTTKTKSSVRMIDLPQWIIDELPKRGPVISCSMNALTKRFLDYVDKSGLPHFRLHDLRHYSASTMVALGIDLQTVKDRHGWTSIRTAEQCYIDSIKSMQKEQNKKLLDHLETLKKDHSV